jgi:hypothetical protein
MKIMLKGRVKVFNLVQVQRIRKRKPQQTLKINFLPLRSKTPPLNLVYPISLFTFLLTCASLVIDGEPKTKIEQAEDSWKEAESTHSSVINDLFGGQICTSILCPKCQTHSYNFQKFYTLSVPVPIGVCPPHISFYIRSPTLTQLML